MIKPVSLALLAVSLLTACASQTPTKTSTPTRSLMTTSESRPAATSSTRPASSEQASSTATNPSATPTESKTQTPASSASPDTSPEKHTEPTEHPEPAQPAQPLPTNEDLYATTLQLVGADTTAGAATHYAFHDIDGNGTAELITAQIGNGNIHPAATYYLQDGVATYLTHGSIGGSGGRRSFTIYTDGTVETDEWGGSQRPGNSQPLPAGCRQ